MIVARPHRDLVVGQQRWTTPAVDADLLVCSRQHHGALCSSVRVLLLVLRLRAAVPAKSSHRLRAVVIVVALLGPARSDLTLDLWSPAQVRIRAPVTLASPVLSWRLCTARRERREYRSPSRDYRGALRTYLSRDLLYSAVRAPRGASDSSTPTRMYRPAYRTALAACVLNAALAR
jgi:hypothetical protein